MTPEFNTREMSQGEIDHMADGLLSTTMDGIYDYLNDADQKPTWEELQEIVKRIEDSNPKDLLNSFGDASKFVTMQVAVGVAKSRLRKIGYNIAKEILG